MRPREADLSTRSQPGLPPGQATGLHRALHQRRSKHLGSDRRSCSRSQEIRRWIRPQADRPPDAPAPRPRICPRCRRAISVKAPGRTPPGRWCKRPAHVRGPGRRSPVPARSMVTRVESPSAVSRSKCTIPMRAEARLFHEENQSSLQTLHRCIRSSTAVSKGQKLLYKRRVWIKNDESIFHLMKYKGGRPMLARCRIGALADLPSRDLVSAGRTSGSAVRRPFLTICPARTAARR
jgi:hypothetical protein